MPERATDGADRLQSISAPPKDALALEYAALEAALRGTPLGRWFLNKHARQNRTPETQFLLDAIAKGADEFDQLAAATGAATSEILAAAETIQEVSWCLREKGIALEFCDTLDQRATDIYTACAFQETTGQRTGKVARTHQFVEQRVSARGAGGETSAEHLEALTLAKLDAIKRAALFG